MLLYSNDILKSNIQHFYDDDTIYSYLYIKDNVEKGSNLLLPNFTSMHFEINRILYDYNITILSSTFIRDYHKLLSVIVEQKIDYLFINKDGIRDQVLTRLLNLHTMTLELEKEDYCLIKVDL